VLGYDLFAYADLERPAIHAIKAMRVEISKRVEAFAH
jgi:hypothetical protein